MPYILAPTIRKNMPGLWREGAPYSSEVIYDICSTDAQSPPVHYESHLIKPHSICHYDAPGHVLPGGETIDQLLEGKPAIFFGPTLVVRLKSPRFLPANTTGGISHWLVGKEDLRSAIAKLTPNHHPEKVFLTFENAPRDFYASNEQAITLSLEAVEWLTSEPSFNLFGTVWKSTDFQPGSRERPIHRTLFRQAGIIECLDLTGVPEGQYFLSAFPIPLAGATESPVCPVLFRADELRAGL